MFPQSRVSNSFLASRHAVSRHLLLLTVAAVCEVVMLSTTATAATKRRCSSSSSYHHHSMSTTTTASSPAMMNLLNLLLLLGFFSNANTVVVNAQEPPNRYFQLEPFELPSSMNAYANSVDTSNGNTSTTVVSRTFRQDFCELHRQVFSNDYDNLTIGNALNGIAIRPLLIVDSEFLNFDIVRDNITGEIINQTLNSEYPGLEGQILDEVCSRAKCTWRNSYSIFNPPLSDGRTWTDMLLWSTSTYDLSVDWWIRTWERLQDGTTFLDPWYDATIIMVRARPDGQDSGFNPLAWTYPFDTLVWLMVIVTVLVSAVAYWGLERLDPNSDKRDEQLQPVETTWLFATAFAGQFEFDPQTNAARLFTFSVAFWALLMSAAYTANLASFLVIKNQTTIQIKSLEQAVSMQIPMCIARSTATDLAVTSAFQNYASDSNKLVRKDNSRGVYEGIRDGQCQIGITTVSNWKNFQHDESVNGDCKLEWIGRPFESPQAGFAVRSDAGTLCTSLVRDALNVHLLGMLSDGTINRLWDKHINRTATVHCNGGGGGSDDGEENGGGEDGRRLVRILKSANNAAAEAGGNNDNEEFTDTTQLTIENMGGVFLLHGILTALSVLWALLQWLRVRRMQKKQQQQPQELTEVTSNDDLSSQPIKSKNTGFWSCDSNVAAEEDGGAAAERQGSPHAKSILSGEVGRDFAVELMRNEMNEKLMGIEDKLAKILQEKKDR